MTEPKQPPEMVLIETARLTAPKVSVAKAAKEAGISESRWRQLAKGYQQVTKETRLVQTAPNETLARMAKAVGVTPDELRSTGREQAAKELERLEEGAAATLEHGATAAESSSPDSPPTQVFNHGRALLRYAEMDWRATKDLATSVTKLDSIDYSVQHQAWRTVAITTDVWADILIASDAAVECRPLIEDMFLTMERFRVWLENQQKGTASVLEDEAQSDASPTGDKNKEALGGSEKLEDRGGRPLWLGGSTDTDDSTVDGTQDGEQGHDLPGA